MTSPRVIRVLQVYQALIYATGLLILCRVIPSWGVWYSASSNYREQVEAFLRGDLALSHNAADLKMDLCWSEKGVQQVWGLGVPLWQMPFDVLAKIFGRAVFPDRVALGFFMALSAFIVLRIWCGESSGAGAACRPFAAPAGVVLLLLLFPPVTYLLRSSVDHYCEPLIYVHFYGVMLSCGLIALGRAPGWPRFWLVCFLSGAGGLIRPTLVLYGFATLPMALLVMWNHELAEGEFRLRLLQTRKFFCHPKLLAGLLLFVCGGGLLFITNYLRFGSGWEFGHGLNVSPALTSVYSTRFDYPFKHVSLTEAARELFGASFLAKEFNGVAWYDHGIFPGQSSVIRWRGFDMTTFDLSFFGLLVAAWGIGLWTLVNSWRPVTKEQGVMTKRIPEHVLLILWSMIASALLAGFYLRVPALADRYILDFSPAFASALAGLWLWLLGRRRAERSRQISIILFVGLIGWLGVEILRNENMFGSPRSVMAGDLPELAEEHPTILPLPNQYKIGDVMRAWRIPYNGEGWNASDGKVWSCAIFYVESPQYLKLELAAGPGSHVTQASLTNIQAKVGLEYLQRSFITSSNGGWEVSFSGPKSARYQTGLQPVYVAMVPSSELGDYVIPPSPWILKRVSWRDEKMKPL